MFVFLCPMFDSTDLIQIESPPEREMDEQHMNFPLWVSISVSFVFLVVTSGLLCGLIWAQRVVSINIQSDFPFGVTPFFLMSLLVSACFSVINIVWSFLSFKLTQRERWSSWSSFQKSHGAKIIVMKIVLASLMYLFLSLIITPNDSVTCVANTVGNSYLIVIGTELLVSLFIKTLLPSVILCKTKERTLEFDVAEEMLQLFIDNSLFNYVVSSVPGLVSFLWRLLFWNFSLMPCV